MLKGGRDNIVLVIFDTLFWLFLFTPRVNTKLSKIQILPLKKKNVEVKKITSFGLDNKIIQN